MSGCNVAQVESADCFQILSRLLSPKFRVFILTSDTGLAAKRVFQGSQASTLPRFHAFCLRRLVMCRKQMPAYPRKRVRGVTGRDGA